MVADAGPLVDGGVIPDHGPVADLHLAGQRDAVGNHATAPRHAVVAHVNIGHQQVMVADDTVVPVDAVPRLMVTYSRMSL